MSTEENPKRPALRVVAPDEKPAAPPQSAPSMPSAAATAFALAVEGLGAEVPLKAAFLTCVGCRLADAALDFYHSAAAHARPGTWRHDIPPGMKSAEATRAWLGTHLEALKAKAQEPDAGTAPYKRGSDLRQAALLACSDLNRAQEMSSAAGLWFEQRRDDLFQESTGSLEAVASFEVTSVPDVEPAPQPQEEIEYDTYLLGLTVLGVF